MHSDFIDELGGPSAVGGFVGVSGHVAWNWRERGIPWKFRHRVAVLAATKNKKLPPGFLEEAVADLAHAANRPRRKAG